MLKVAISESLQFYFEPILWRRNIQVNASFSPSWERTESTSSRNIFILKYDRCTWLGSQRCFTAGALLVYPSEFMQGVNGKIQLIFCDGDASSLLRHYELGTRFVKVIMDPHLFQSQVCRLHLQDGYPSACSMHGVLAASRRLETLGNLHFPATSLPSTKCIITFSAETDENVSFQLPNWVIINCQATSWAVHYYLNTNTRSRLFTTITT